MNNRAAGNISVLTLRHDSPRSVWCLSPYMTAFRLLNIMAVVQSVLTTRGILPLEESTGNNYSPLREMKDSSNTYLLLSRTMELFFQTLLDVGSTSPQCRSLPSFGKIQSLTFNKPPGASCLQLYLKCPWTRN